MVVVLAWRQQVLGRLLPHRQPQHLPRPRLLLRPPLRRLVVVLAWPGLCTQQARTLPLAHGDPAPCSTGSCNLLVGGAVQSRLAALGGVAGAAACGGSPAGRVISGRWPGLEPASSC
jgi:hypothetical protein